MTMVLIQAFKSHRFSLLISSALLISRFTKGIGAQSVKWVWFRCWRPEQQSSKPWLHLWRIFMSSGFRINIGQRLLSSLGLCQIVNIEKLVMIIKQVLKRNMLLGLSLGGLVAFFKQPDKKIIIYYWNLIKFQVFFTL